MRRMLATLAGLLLSVTALAAVTLTESTEVTLLRGTSTVRTLPGWDACLAEARRLANADTRTSGTVTYTCQTERRRVVAAYRPNPPPPVDCVVSEWSDWQGGAWSACVSNVQTRSETRTRSILVEPAFGGAACPALTEERVATQACTVTPPAGVFRDQFNYVVNPNDPADVKRARFQAAGWNSIKDETTQPGRARGWLSTASSIPGYSGPHPTPRFLKFEARPSLGVGAAPPYQNQTDTYLGRGAPGTLPCTTCALPGNVWFQFYAFVTADSRWAARNKGVYPSDDGTASGSGLENAFMIHFRPSNQAGLTQAYGPNFYGVTHVEGASITSTAPEGGGRLGQNLTNAGAQLAGAWYQHRFHFDHSQEHGVYEHWIRPMGGTWLKTSEWRSGITPGFTWITHPHLRNGHPLFKLFTTFGTAQADDGRLYDVDLYLADFVYAPSEAGLD